MNALKVLLLGGVGLYILSKLGIAQIGAALNFRLKGVSFSNGVVLLNLGAQNPRNASFVVNGLTGNVSIGGREVGNVSMLNPVRVAANSETTIPIELRPSILGAASLLVDALRGNVDLKAPVVLDAVADVQGTVIPFSVNYSI